MMAAFECPKYFGAQLDSIIGQSHRNWHLWISDDSTNESMHEVFLAYAEQLEGRATMLCGPKAGFVRNFLSMVCNPAIQGRYYAFADHDDVWHACKLERALEWLKGLPADIPALYCGRTRLIDETDGVFGQSPLFTRPPSFSNALVQNLAGGNTMVFNDAARGLVARAGADVDVVVHDWWFYIALTACGGCVYYDPVPAVDYRQHGENLIGCANGWVARLKRFHAMIAHRSHADWLERNVVALERLGDCMTEENRTKLACFVLGRKGGLLQRVDGIRASGAYRQTWVGTVGLWLAAIFSRI